MRRAARPSQTLQRLERILVLVPWLLENPGVDLDEISERFDVDRDVLLHDLDLLGYCGLPGYGGGDLIDVSVFGDRVHVRMAPYFERPLRLSLREAVTLLLAARAAASVDGLAAADPLQRAIGRLESLLGAEAGQGARIAIDLGGPGDDRVGPLRHAIERRRVVRLTYRSAQGVTRTRDVEPWALSAAEGAWYLQGHCRTAEAPRDFRLDRIRDLEVLDERAGPIPEVVEPPGYIPSDGDERFVLEVASEARWITEWAVVDDVTELDGGRARIAMRTPDLRWAARLVLRLGDAARIVEPEQLAPEVAALNRRTLQRYDAAGADAEPVADGG